MIGILDYGMGNIKSVQNAIEYIGYDVHIVTGGSDFEEITHLVIPGVGTYSEAMQNIESYGLLEPLTNFISSGSPVLGICLGMQILSTSGFEVKHTSGLNYIPGTVKPFPNSELPIPHSGWNSLTLSCQHPLFEGIHRHVDFYFVHSFYYECNDSEMILSKTDYGFDFTSTVFKENIVGVQFHPEKSQSNGLKLLENFCEWDGAC